MNAKKLKEQLKRHEGLRLKPYTDTVGKLTIGIGRNLEDKGISEKEADIMLENDIEYFHMKLTQRLEWFYKLCECRQNVLVNMAFNLGVGGLLTFRNMLAFVELGDYDLAADEMLDSKWANQVSNRAIELANQMRTGEYQ